MTHSSHARATRFRRGARPAAIAVLVALMVSACSTVSSSTSSSVTTSSASSTVSGSTSSSGTTSAASDISPPSSSGTSTGPAVLQAELQKGYAGDFKPPPTSGPKAVKGKNIWFISCGQLFAACQEQTAGFKEAAAVLGWNLTVQDGKADPTTAASLVRQAITAHVDGIGMTGYDCPTIKSALQEAKAANIPVVNYAAVDCNDPSLGAGGPQLYTSVRLRGSARGIDFQDSWTRARVPYIVAKAGPSAKIIAISEQSYSAQKSAEVAFNKAIAEQCPGCTLYKVPFTFAQVPNPATQIWTTGIQSHPDATVVEEGIDALMSLGLQTAVAQSGRKGLLVGGGEGYQVNFDLIRKGVQTFSVAIPYNWIAWGMADTLNRLLAGQAANAIPDEGSGWQYVDLQHNLPAAGSDYEPPINFRASYNKIWKG